MFTQHEKVFYIRTLGAWRSPSDLYPNSYPASGLGRFLSLSGPQLG